jgi:hypothetical protein
MPLECNVRTTSLNLRAADEHEVAGDGGLAAAGRLQVDTNIAQPSAVPERARLAVLIPAYKRRFPLVRELQELSAANFGALTGWHSQRFGGRTFVSPIRFGCPQQRSRREGVSLRPQKQKIQTAPQVSKR